MSQNVVVDRDTVANAKMEPEIAGGWLDPEILTVGSTPPPPPATVLQRRTFHQLGNRVGSRNLINWGQ